MNVPYKGVSHTSSMRQEQACTLLQIGQALARFTTSVPAAAESACYCEYPAVPMPRKACLISAQRPPIRGCSHRIDALLAH